MSPDEVRRGYEINKDFHEWFDAYLVHSVFSFDSSLDDPIVVYSADFWRNERKKEELNRG